jgi:hypothetical protein
MDWFYDNSLLFIHSDYAYLSSLDQASFRIRYAPHHPLTYDCWDEMALFSCERYSPHNISRKNCLQVSHGRWRFSPPSIIGSCLVWDMLVILMSSSCWTVEIEIRDSDEKLIIGEKYNVNFQVILVLFRSKEIFVIMLWFFGMCHMT